ncbi:MAG: glucose-6-phosphate isomerase [Proteobacteria bacterium]|nr:glucose-6-phosphate isomerase [Pseudomonadota bacterium]
MFEYIENLALIKHLDSEFSTAPYQTALEKLKNFSHIIHLGTGGSSLGPQALYAIAEKPTVTFTFLDNIDPCGIISRLQGVDFAKCGLLVASKSGNTAETLVQLATLKSFFSKKGLNFKDHLVIITQTDDNALHTFAKQNEIVLVPHHNQIGGRFAVFAEVGVLPGLLMGLDMSQFQKGAISTIEALKKEKDKYLPITTADYLAKSKFHPVVFSYSDKLKLFGAWFSQLWAESLGKENQNGERFGSIPIQALGATDQHSQLQLYIDGPRDKFFTFIEVTNHTDLEVADLEIDHPSYTPLRGHSLSELLKAELEATYATLKNHRAPLRLTIIPEVNPYYLGQLMMNAVIETLYVAKIWGVDPFDQPAVEEGKVLALKFLNG